MDTLRFFLFLFGFLLLTLGFLALVLVGIWKGAHAWARHYVVRYVLDGTEGQVDASVMDAFGRRVAYFCYTLLPLILIGVIYLLLLRTQAGGLNPNMVVAKPGLGAMAIFGLAMACLGGLALYDGWRSLVRLRNEYRKLGSAAH